MAGLPDRLGRLGLGTAPIGNLYHEVSDETAAATVTAAWDAGIRYFDTAPHYGLGLAETRLGAALAAYRREEFVVSTKVGRLLVESAEAAWDDEGFAVSTTLRRQWDFSGDGARRSLEASCRRLDLDRVDVALVHDPDDFVDEALSGAVPALATLRDDGVVDAIGVGTNSVATALAFVEGAPIDVVVLAGRYTLLDRRAADRFLPMCAERGVTVIAAGVFNSGLLATPTPGAESTFDYLPVENDLLDRARDLAARCDAFGVSLPAAAMRFPLRRPEISTILVGAASPAEVTADVDYLEAGVPAALWESIEDAGADAGVPEGGR